MIELTENQIELIHGAALTTPIGNLCFQFVDAVNGIANFVSPVVNAFGFIPMFDSLHRIFDNVVGSGLQLVINVGKGLDADYRLRNVNHYRVSWRSRPWS